MREDPLNFQGFIGLAIAFAQLADQPCILDGDGGLPRK